MRVIASMEHTVTKRALASYGAAVGAGLAFGAADQYLGTLNSVGAAVSNLATPWLLFAFGLGFTQCSAGRAARIGLTGLVSAVIGYTLMIMAPVEGVHGLTAPDVVAVGWSQARWLLAALIFGPGYGLLGYMWRSRRSKLSAALMVAPVLIEAAAKLTGLEQGLTTVSWAEIIFGIALVGYFAVGSQVRPS